MFVVDCTAMLCYSAFLILFLHCIVSHMSLQHGGPVVCKSWDDHPDCSWHFLFEDGPFTLELDGLLQRWRVFMTDIFVCCCCLSCEGVF